MNLEQVRKEIEGLGQSLIAEKMYPMTSNWVPITDVMAILNRFEKDWRNYKPPEGESAGKLIARILGD